MNEYSGFLFKVPTETQDNRADAESFSEKASERNSDAEKDQNKYIQKWLSKICKKNDITLEPRKCTKNGPNAFWFPYHKNLTQGRKKGEKKNNGRDSKSMDSCYVLNKNGKNLYVFGFYKFTKQKGGMQEIIPYEVTTTLDRIHESTNKNILVVFYLCGEFWKMDDSVFDDEKFSIDNRVIGLKPSLSFEDKEKLLENRIINFFNE